LTRKGADAMPTWRNELYNETPKGKFRFITGRHAQFTQNSTANNAMLLDLVRENFVWINKNQADKLNINYGDWVEIKSDTGKVRIKAYPTNRIIEDVVFYVHGFGATSDELTLGYRNGASDNIIIKDDIEKTFGSAVMHETDVDITKVVQS
jgi:thiosulfate reductase/polysulfide reductase chain A